MNFGDVMEVSWRMDNAVRQGYRAFRQLLVAAGLCLLAGLWAVSAQTADQLALDAALRDFEVGQWDRASEGFAEFMTRFPDSPLKAEAVQRGRFARAEAAFALSLIHI